MEMRFASTMPVVMNVNANKVSKMIFGMKISVATSTNVQSSLGFVITIAAIIMAVTGAVVVKVSNFLRTNELANW